MQKSISKQVEEILNKEYYYQKAIELDIVNFSSIAKKLQEKTGGNLEAVKVAVMRWAEKHKKTPSQVKDIKTVLKKSSVSLESNCYGFILEKYKYSEKLKGEKVIDKDFMLLITKDPDQVKNALLKHKDVYKLTIESPLDIEKTAGVVDFILSKLASAGINVLEFYSCYNKTNLLLHKKDAVDAFKIIEEMTS